MIGRPEEKKKKKKKKLYLGRETLVYTSSLKMILGPVATESSRKKLETLKQRAKRHANNATGPGAY